ncbi:hypothetical protein [Nonomuraea cavernae]|uniref:hypothetical protein n=1 Tax=Nonomuraea cavernae TaxID=2045107 RepID=UPI0033D67858
MAGVLAIAGLGIFLAFTGTSRPAPEKAPIIDQEAVLSGGSSIPSPTPQARYPAPSPAAPTPGEHMGPAGQAGRPAEVRTVSSGGHPAPVTRWLEALPPPAATAAKALPQEDAADAVIPPARGGDATPAATERGPAGSLAPGPTQPRAAATQPTPTVALPALPSVTAPARPAATQPPVTARRTPPPEPPAPPIRGADPCATFDDFRRPYCDQLLDGLHR